MTSFFDWAKKNNVGSPIEGNYDYQASFEKGLGIDPVTRHWSDIGKLPMHETFSTESKYYKPGQFPLPAKNWNVGMEALASMLNQ